jgi:hypothetical protein
MSKEQEQEVLEEEQEREEVAKDEEDEEVATAGRAGEARTRGLRHPQPVRARSAIALRKCRRYGLWGNTSLIFGAAGLFPGPL